LREPSKHLIENVIVFFIGEWPNNSRLIQEVAVNLGPVERSICHLHLNEVSLNKQTYRNIESSEYADISMKFDGKM
jgi:hypothetical protein